MKGNDRRRARRAGPLTAVLAPLGLIALLTTATVDGGFTAQLGASNSFQSGTLQIASTPSAGSTCLTATNSAGSITSATSTNCSGAGPLSGSTGTASTLTIANEGSITPTATLSPTNACGLQQFADSGAGSSSTTFADSAGSNTATAQGGVTGATAGPTQFTDSPYAATFNGSTGWLETTTSMNPQTSTYAFWFKTSTKNEGIMGYTNTQSNSTPGNWDRMFWLDSNGYLVFGVYPNAIFEVSSSSTTTHNYADGAWHYVAATLTPVSSTKGTVELYVDGTLVAGSASNETITSSQPQQNYSGWLHIGWNYTNTWTDAPSSNYFTGQLADISQFPTALSSAQVATLAGETTQAAFASQVSADSPTYFWTLQDHGGVSPALANGHVAFAGSGPTTVSGSVSATLTGGYGESTLAYAAPQTFSLAAWFKTSTSGPILGMTSSQLSGSATNYDRMLWVDSSGHLVFGIKSPSSGNFEVTSSTTSAANGNWHLAVATVSVVSSTTATVLLYQDGTQVGGSTTNETISSSDSGTAYTGYWHLGAAYTSGWTNAPSNATLTGSLADIAVIPSAISSANVSTIFGETSQSALATEFGTLGAENLWTLQDAGTSLYTTGTPCQYIGVTIGTAGTCYYPAQSGACPSTGSALSSLASANLPVTGSAVTITPSELSGIPSWMVGTHVYEPLQITATSGGFSESAVYSVANSDYLTA